MVIEQDEANLLQAGERSLDARQTNLPYFRARLGTVPNRGALS
jgi:hypothetical protein